ncbi:hypothetical protein [Bacillus xiapuensis]|uniref:Uncharacterized protein n=1 Tax=Bacillus xiapuensis TaxID=2014075 RepID=A0ABU6N8H2_9BACI|nr:hypothetical protein [Bacillus xiapuensis]
MFFAPLQLLIEQALEDSGHLGIVKKRFLLFYNPLMTLAPIRSFKDFKKAFEFKTN